MNININKSKIIYILILILEIFGTIVFSKCVLSIFTTKMYNGNLFLKDIIFVIFFGLLVLSINIYIYIKNKERIEKIFLPIGIAIGICYAIFILPFNVPDEEAHMIKAYDISIGHIFPKIEDDKRLFLYNS